MNVDEPERSDERPEEPVRRPRAEDDDVLIVEDVDEGARAALLEEIEGVARPKPSAEGVTSEDPVEEATAPASTDELTLLRDELRTARESEAAARERQLRALADYENLRRRTQKEKDDFSRNVLGNFVREILPVVDNLEAALATPAPAVEDAQPDHFRAGVELIARQMRDVLQRLGLSEVPAEGVEFDPAVHEAVARRETSEAAANTVVRVMRKGYRLHDRLLRAALVEVAVKPEGESSS